MIPKLIGTTKYNRNKCIVIEYINGQTLSSMKSIILEKITYYIFKIMLIIEFFHLNGYVLRDLKPNNIMIDINDNSIFIDFDRLIFHKSISETDDHTNSFSSAYISPEANSQDFSYETDIFSLGKIIYFIINEKIPENDDECFNRYKNLESYFHTQANIQIDQYILLYYYMCNKEYKKRQFISKLINLFCLQFIDFIELFDLRDLFRRNESISKQKLSNDSYTQNSIKAIDLRKWNNDKFGYKKMLEYYTQQSQTNVYEQFIFLHIYFGNKYIDINGEKILEHISLFAIAKGDSPYNIIIDYITYQADQYNDQTMQLMLRMIYIMYEFEPINQNNIDFMNKLQIPKFDYSNLYNNKLLCKLKNIFKDCPPNYTKGIEYLTKAANQNNSIAQLMLANLNDENIFIKRDLDKSMYYLNLAKNNPLLKPFFNGSLFLNDRKGIDFLSSYLANHQNQRSSILVNGLIHLTDKFFDIKKSIQLLNQLAECEDEYALFGLGLIYSRFSFFPNYSKYNEFFYLPFRLNKIYFI